MTMGSTLFGSVPIPLADEAKRNEIGDLVLQANDYRNTAWGKECEAIMQFETTILGANSKQII